MNQTNNKPILYFPPGIKTQEGLTILKNNNFCCGYYYEVPVNGTIIKKTIFYNQKNDLLNLKYTDDNFHLSKEVSKLYVYRKVFDTFNKGKIKIFDPINPFNYLETKKTNLLPTPLDINDFAQVFNQPIYPFPENPKVELYKRSHNETHNMETITRISNRYLFKETYENFNSHLQAIYKPLLDIHMDLFYESIADVLTNDNGENIVNEVIKLLEITLDYDYLINKFKLLQQSTAKPTVKDFLKDYRQKLINRQKIMLEKPKVIINRHNEWFTNQNVNKIFTKNKYSIKRY